MKKYWLHIGNICSEVTVPEILDSDWKYLQWDTFVAEILALYWEYLEGMTNITEILAIKWRDISS